MYDAAAYAIPILAASVLEYHASEVLLVRFFSPEELSSSSLLMSAHYLVAMSVGLAEHFAAAYLFPSLSAAAIRAVHIPAVALLVAGEALRKAAFITARSAFTHRIKAYRRPGHHLVRHGVYGYIRHPGYLGWFLWAIGTQLLLANPLCFVAFTVIAWRFFAERIRMEEFHLVRIFGEPYIKYRQTTRTWFPGIP